MTNFKFLQEENKAPVKKELQFPSLKIRHPIAAAKITEAWIIENGDVIELGKDVELIVIAVRGQYFRFDSQLQRTTHITEIKPIPQIRQARCVKTGKTVEQLKAEFGDNFKKEFTFAQVVFGIVKVKDKWQEVVWYVKNSSLRSMIDIQNELGLKNIVGYHLQLGLKVNKSGGVVYATPLLKQAKNLSELPDNILKTLPDLDKLYEAFMKEVAFYNSTEASSFKEEATADDMPVEF
jgi:hypothetical protein